VGDAMFWPASDPCRCTAPRMRTITFLWCRALWAGFPRGRCRCSKRKVSSEHAHILRGPFRLCKLQKTLDTTTARKAQIVHRKYVLSTRLALRAAERSNIFCAGVSPANLDVSG
jgi:hypothetical protein